MNVIYSLQKILLSNRRIKLLKNAVKLMNLKNTIVFRKNQTQNNTLNIILSPTIGLCLCFFQETIGI